MLVQAYPMLKGFLGFMLHFVSTDTGLVEKNGFDYLGDWLSPHGNGKGNDAELYNNAYIVYALKKASEIVAAISDESVAPAADGTRFRAGADAIGKALHAKFFSTMKDRYVETESNSSVQGYQVLPLMAGITPPALIPVVLGALIDEISTTTGHIDTGLTTTYFMAKLLSGTESNIMNSTRNDLLYTMTMQKTGPSYAALVEDGLTTWPETWTAGKIAGGVSKMHGTLNGFGLWSTGRLEFGFESTSLYSPWHF
jgi:hypothetical protein